MWYGGSAYVYFLVGCSLWLARNKHFFVFKLIYTLCTKRGCKEIKFKLNKIKIYENYYKITSKLQTS